MSKSIFEIRIAGADVRPESISVGELADLLVDFETSVLAVAEFEELSTDDDAPLSLVAVNAGSSRMAFSIVAAYLVAIQKVSEAVAEQRYDGLPSKSHRALHEISNQATKRGWSIEFVANKALGVRHGIVSERSPVPAAPSRTVVGSSTIYGRCLRVGGATRPRAELRLNDGTLLNVNVTESQAKTLARRLYEPVCLRGAATWEAAGWKLEGFNVAEVVDFQPLPLKLAFERLAATAGSAWDGIDAVDFVQAQRRGDPG